MKKKLFLPFLLTILFSIPLMNSVFSGNKTLQVKADLTTTGWTARDGVTTISSSTTGVQFDLAGVGKFVSTSYKLNLDGLTFDVTAELRSTQDVSNGDYSIYFSNDTGAYPGNGKSLGPIINVHNNVDADQTRIAFTKEFAYLPGKDSSNNVAYSSPTGDTKFSNAQTTDGTAVLNRSTTQSFRFQFKAANANRYEVSVHELVPYKIWGDNPNFGDSDLTNYCCFRAYIDKGSFPGLTDGCNYLFIGSASGANIKVENVQFLVPIKGVIDGVVTSDTYTTMVRSGLVPPDYLVFGYSFDGWYTDSSLSTPLTKVEASTQVIYGKFTSLKTKKIRFDIAQSSFAGQGAYLYAFESNGTKNAEWPGVPLQMSGNLSEWVNVPYDATVIINNGNGAQSNDIHLSGLDSDICYINSSNKGYWASNGHYYILGDSNFNSSISHADSWGDGGNLLMEAGSGDNRAYYGSLALDANSQIRVVKGYTNEDGTAGYNWMNSGMSYDTYSIKTVGDNIELKGGGTYKLFVNGSDNVYAAVHPTYFADNWLYILRANCDIEGESSNLAGIQNVWTNLKTDYDTMDPADKALFINASPSDASSVYKDAVQLYDLIYSKYSVRLALNDFMGRFNNNSVITFYLPSYFNSKALINMDFDLSSIIALSISLIASLSVGIYFIYRNKVNKKI